MLEIWEIDFSLMHKIQENESVHTQKAKPIGWLTNYKSLIFSKLKQIGNLTFPSLLTVKISSLSFRRKTEGKKNLNQNSTLRCDDLMWNILHSEFHFFGLVIYLCEFHVLSTDCFWAPFSSASLPPPLPHSPMSIYFSVVLTFSGQGQSESAMLGMMLNLKWCRFLLQKQGMVNFLLKHNLSFTG